MSKYGQTVRIQSKGLNKVLRRRVFANDHVRKKIDSLANRVVLKYEGEMKKRVPVRTGTLKRSIYAYTRGMMRAFTATNTNYALKVNTKSSRPRYAERTVDETSDWVEKEIDKLLKGIL